MSTIDTSNIDPTKPAEGAAKTKNVRDNVSAVKTQLGNAKTDIESLETTVGDITAAEADQIENINSVTVSNTQWTYVGSLDQALATTDAVSFATVDTGQGANELYAMDQDVRTTDTPEFAGTVINVENATDSGTDAYVSATNTSAPGDGRTIVRDFQSANTTTTPTLDTLTITTRDGSALWAGALSGVHTLQLASGGGSWLVLDPNPLDGDQPASVAYVDQRVAPITAADDGNLTWHEADQQAVSASSYATIFDIASPAELLSGSIFGFLPGARLTVDGVVVFDRTSLVTGDDGSGNASFSLVIPQARATSSMKLEAYNASGSSRDMGWRVVTR